MFDDSNEDLLAKYQQGDLKAFEAFYERNHKLIFYFLISRVSSQSVAEDLLQDTFLKMHRNITRYDPRQKALPWVFTIARNNLIDHMRKSKDVSHEDMDIFAQAESAESAQDEVGSMLSSLNADERKLIEERFLADQSYEQIAAKEKSSPVAVRKRVSRAMSKLRLKFSSST